MSSATFSAPADERAPGAGDLVQCILWLLWQCIRVPALLLLVVFEPVVSFVLGSLALLGVLTALFWKLVRPPHFPFFLVLGISSALNLRSCSTMHSCACSPRLVIHWQASRPRFAAQRTAHDSLGMTDRLGGGGIDVMRDWRGNSGLTRVDLCKILKLSGSCH